jgi:DNA excision repair protein ERCC-6
MIEDAETRNVEVEFSLRPRKKRRLASAAEESSDDGPSKTPRRRPKAAGSENSEDFSHLVSGDDVSDEFDQPTQAALSKRDYGSKQKIDLSRVDDGNESQYQSRLAKWVKDRRAIRQAIPESLEAGGNDDRDEWFKPTPGKSDRHIIDGYRLPGEVHDFLFPFQRVGIEWLAELHRRLEGGILCDEMGLGKTGKPCLCGAPGRCR